MVYIKILSSNGTLRVFDMTSYQFINTTAPFLLERIYQINIDTINTLSKLNLEEGFRRFLYSIFSDYQSVLTHIAFYSFYFSKEVPPSPTMVS